MSIHPARRLWHLAEPLHAVVYFAPERREAYTAAGLKGGWMGYFASRSAAMGPVSAATVTAAFYNFHPAMVARAIPDAWNFSSPRRVLEARFEVVDKALRRVLGPTADSQEVAEAANLAWQAAAGCDVGGRPLFAAHTTLPMSESPHVAIWQAATLIREHRGDGHVAALVVEKIDGCEANVLMAADGLVSPEEQRDFRGWSRDEWGAAVERLRSRDLLDARGALTADGRRTRDRIEARTDELAMPVLTALGGEIDKVGAVLQTLRDRLVESEALPYPNPMGLPPTPGLPPSSQHAAGPPARP